MAKIWRRGFLVRIATWNINFVRLCLYNVLRFIKEQNINVICLQETLTLLKTLCLKQFNPKKLKWSVFGEFCFLKNNTTNSKPKFEVLHFRKVGFNNLAYQVFHQEMV